jgi:hypothetical protein
MHQTRETEPSRSGNRAPSPATTLAVPAPFNEAAASATRAESGSTPTTSNPRSVIDRSQ